MSDRLKRTLRYCFILYVFIVPVYFIFYQILYPETPWRTALISSVLFGVVNVIFLGSLHYFRVRRDEDA